MSHMIQLFSTEPVRSAVESGAQARSCTSSEWPRSRVEGFHACSPASSSPIQAGWLLSTGFQTTTSPPSPPDARDSPVGENLTQFTVRACPSREARCSTVGAPSSPAPTFQNLISLSPPPVASMPVVGWKSTENTGSFPCHRTWIVLAFIATALANRLTPCCRHSIRPTLERAGSRGVLATALGRGWPPVGGVGGVVPTGA
mmetsp:Transcript_51001/g.163197  ORF Transcript_51001/g.163197 Transcript_51001/m.163197 type:complete len:201 (-) Transcript_51001:6-608(-)